VRIPQIQGLRALAAILVVIFHAKFIAGGFIGVDIFYAISGYLITGLILKEIDTKGNLQVRDFYARRIKRLLPASSFVILVTAIAGIYMLPSTVRASFGRDLIAAATYSSNYLFAWWHNDYQNLDAVPSPFIHYWSLAVEEQFYLVWPIFILLLARHGKRAVLYGVLSLTALSLVFSVFLTHALPIWAFYSLATRAWELGFGALILFIPHTFWKKRFIPWIGFFGTATAALSFSENTSFPGYTAILPVGATAIMIGSIPYWPKFLNDLSNNQLSQWLGKISYPLYLWHWPVLVLPISWLDRQLQIRERIFCILLTVALAHLTNKYIEEPIRIGNIQRKWIFKAFALTTLLSVSSGFLIINTASATINVIGSNFKFDLLKVQQTPVIYHDGCHLTFSQTKSPLCTYGDTKSESTIILYGDSHAAQWFPTLEKIAIDRGLKLVSLTKSSCPAVDISRDNKGAFLNRDCIAWRKDSVNRIRNIHPLAIITSSFQYYDLPKDANDRSVWWKDGQIRLLDQLQGSSDHLIYIGDTPRPSSDVPNCLATRGLDKCSTVKKTTFTVIDGFEKIDPTPWLCPTTCQVVQDGYLVYRDASHISVAAAIALREQLEASLGSKGLFP
jgi:peptidoglycan/LPS O-acetylase OafA/YrhL